MAKNRTIPTQEQLEEVRRLGDAVYSTRLKSYVEPEYNNQFIAIHVDSGDYAVGKTTAAATRALLKSRPSDGRLYIRKIGDEPEYGLAARLLLSEMADQAK